MAGGAVTACRQHWLRFSWKRTWAAQEVAGIEFDTTLMFNDRPGFRNAAALCWRPWNAILHKQHKVKVQPSVLMDSHLYDYQQLGDSDRQQQIRNWLGECDYVHGQTAVLWHPHTLTKDYGWKQGFESVLMVMKELQSE